jgi:thiazole synthase ThiGH ThiG subunit
MGLAVFAYTINDTVAANTLADVGADAVISNAPDRLALRALPQGI